MPTTPLSLVFVDDGPPYLNAIDLNNVVTAINGAIADAAAAAAAGTAGTPLTPSLIVETSTGVWSGDAPARTLGMNPVIFSGVDDPADVVNGINTPARIAGGDIWLEQL